MTSYRTCDTTGGMPPAACYAPLRKGVAASREEARQRAAHAKLISEKRRHRAAVAYHTALIYKMCRTPPATFRGKMQRLMDASNPHNGVTLGLTIR